MLQPGVRLGERYRLEVRLGAGGMGEVWRAVDEVLSRSVAVKVMLPSVADDPDFARRFLAEATSMARVNHPAVASIHDFGRARGVTYLVMELVDGESLAQFLARAGRLSPADTMRIVAQAAEGLQAVHDRGIVHRDIKPANLLVRRDGSVVITDFGIARHEDASRLTASGAILGTPSYLAPEQVLGQPATARSDVYSLGLTAYECLAGQRPFVGDNPYAVALQRLQAAPRTIGVTLPPAVLAVVQRALATDPADRWPTASALADAARAAATAPPAAPGSNPVAGPGGSNPGVAPGGSPPGVWPGGSAPVAAPGGPVSVAPPGGKRKHSRRRALLAVGVAVVAVIAAGGAWLGTRDHGGSDPETPGATNASTAAASLVGFRSCGDAVCPTAPMCWGGFTAISGKAQPPEQVGCTKNHYWETFAAIPLPDGALDVRVDRLIKRPDVAAACSAQLMASRSRDPGRTKRWRRDVWPIQQPGSGAWLLHCMSGPTDGEIAEPAF